MLTFSAKIMDLAEQLGRPVSWEGLKFWKNDKFKKYCQRIFFIHVINFKEASGRFFFHFLEVFKKMYRIYKNILHSFPGDFKILVNSDIF